MTEATSSHKDGTMMAAAQLERRRRHCNRRNMTELAGAPADILGDIFDIINFEMAGVMMILMLVYSAKNLRH
jgi:hypothetical protein